MNQFLTRIVDLFLDLVASRQHLLRLDFDQHARHRQKITHAVDIQLFQDRKVLQVLVGNGRDGNIDDFNLMLSHKVQKQVHRAAEDIQIDAKIHIDIIGGGERG